MCCIKKFLISEPDWDKDLNDGFALLTSGKCDLERCKSSTSALKESLKDYEAIVGYQALITG